VAGLIVTAFIVHVGWEVTGQLVDHLLDGVDPQLIATAEQAALGLPDVGHAHVRARWMGRSLLVEVEGFVPAGMTIAEGEAVGRQVEDAVAAAVPECRAVLWSPRSVPEG
jgi:divalent metal cation (Fe/Co/Zn/Cd) transporter